MMQIVCNGKEKALPFNDLNTLLTSKRIHTSVSFCSKICFIECMAASTPLVSHLSFGVTQQLFVFPNDVSDKFSNINWANLRILIKWYKSTGTRASNIFGHRISIAMALARVGNCIRSSLFSFLYFSIYDDIFNILLYN